MSADPEFEFHRRWRLLAPTTPRENGWYYCSDGVNWLCVYFVQVKPDGRITYRRSTEGLEQPEVYDERCGWSWAGPIPCALTP